MNESISREVKRHDTSDPIVNSVISKLVNRSNRGMSTYGVAMTRKDISTKQWLLHAQEEALDLANYLERIIQEYDSA